MFKNLALPRLPTKRSPAVQVQQPVGVSSETELGGGGGGEAKVDRWKISGIGCLTFPRAFSVLQTTPTSSLVLEVRVAWSIVCSCLHPAPSPLSLSLPRCASLLLIRFRCVMPPRAQTGTGATMVKIVWQQLYRQNAPRASYVMPTCINTACMSDLRSTPGVNDYFLLCTV